MAIEWLPDAETLGSISPAHLIGAEKEIAQQIGEWTAFSALFGVRDRHTGNWVWSAASRKLAMIDLEESSLGYSGVLQHDIALNHVWETIRSHQSTLLMGMSALVLRYYAACANGSIASLANSSGTGLHVSLATDAQQCIQMLSDLFGMVQTIASLRP